MTEDDNVQAGRKQTLCQKYGISEAQLDFKYVKDCKNSTELEHILKVLRSHEMGYFEKLEEATEARLREVAPNSRTLITPERVPSWNELNTEQQNELRRDYLNWPSNDNASLQELRKETEETPINYPAIRNAGKASISNNKAQVEREKPVKSCAPRSFDSWSKFNVEKELNLIDREDELKNNAAVRANNERKHQHDETVEAVRSGEFGGGDRHHQESANSERFNGNEYFRQKKYEEAILHYSKSINLWPTAEAYNNRAMSYIKVGRFEDALEDCSKVEQWSRNDKNTLSKVLYRRSTALQALHRFQEAYEAIINAVKIDPNCKAIQARVEQLKEIVETPSVKKVRMVIQDQDERKPRPLIEEVAQRDVFYPFTSASDTVFQSDIGTARQMCRCSAGVPPFIAKLRSAENQPSSHRICLRKTGSKKCFNEKDRRNKATALTNGEIIEKDTIEEVEKKFINEDYENFHNNLLRSVAAGDLQSILDELLSQNPSQICQALGDRLDPRTLDLCVRALCFSSNEPNWETLREILVALSQLPHFRSSVKSLNRVTKDALSARIALVEEQGLRVSNIVTLYELNGALPPP